MSYENITIQDCLDNFNYKGKTVLLENGQVIGFYKEGEEDVLWKRINN